MAIVDDMTDIFTENLDMTTQEMMILETILLDCVDLALSTCDFQQAADYEDALLDLHILKLAHLQARGVITFWERYDALTSQNGG